MADPRSGMGGPQNAPTKTAMLGHAVVAARDLKGIREELRTDGFSVLAERGPNTVCAMDMPIKIRGAPEDLTTRCMAVLTEPEVEGDSGQVAFAVHIAPVADELVAAMVNAHEKTDVTAFEGGVLLRLRETDTIVRKATGQGVGNFVEIMLSRAGQLASIVCQTLFQFVPTVAGDTSRVASFLALKDSLSYIALRRPEEEEVPIAGERPGAELEKPRPRLDTLRVQAIVAELEKPPETHTRKPTARAGMTPDDKPALGDVPVLVSLGRYGPGAKNG